MIPFIDFTGRVEKKVTAKAELVKEIIIRDLAKTLERNGASEAWLKTNKASFNAGSGGYLALSSITNGDVIVEAKNDSVSLSYEVSFAGLIIPTALIVIFFEFGMVYLNFPLQMRFMPLVMGLFFYFAPIAQSLARLNIMLEEMLETANKEAQKRDTP